MSDMERNRIEISLCNEPPLCWEFINYLGLGIESESALLWLTDTLNHNMP
jgi:hypothetical protein